MLKLMPKNETFFDLLEQISQHMMTSTERLQEITKRFPDVDEPVSQIEQEEKTAAELTQSELSRLDDAFITPLDREDILHIMTDLYSVVSTIADVAHGFKAYPLKKLDPEFAQQVESLRKIVGSLNDVILQLRKGHKLSEIDAKLKEMHQVKVEADKQFRDFLGKLLSGKSEFPDFMEVVKRKELHDLLETAIDNCENVSQTLQQVVLKNS